MAQDFSMIETGEDFEKTLVTVVPEELAPVWPSPS